MSTEVVITHHAYERARERMSWNKATTKRMALKALTKGRTYQQFAGRVRRFLTGIYGAKRSANNIRVYGQDIYVFRNNRLITLYRLPNELVRLL